MFICTVGIGATSGHTYPFDGLCDQLYYSSVFIAGQDLRSTSADTGLKAFHATMKRYRKTKGGLAFDYFSTRRESISLPGVITTLKDMAIDNVIHYGVLNVFAQGQGLAVGIEKAKGILTEIKKHHWKRKGQQTALGLGVYPESDARWLTTYRKRFTEAVDNNVADIVIAITSFGNLKEHSRCEVLPPGFLYKQPLYPGYPYLADHVLKWKPRRFAWLFLNAHLDNRRDQCKATENFDRISKVKLIFTEETP
ncbi:uncharacterized protein LOC144149854 [Haemaphysalis longicornis]